MVLKLNIFKTKLMVMDLLIKNDWSITWQLTLLYTIKFSFLLRLLISAAGMSRSPCTCPCSADLADLNTRLMGEQSGGPWFSTCNTWMHTHCVRGCLG